MMVAFSVAMFANSYWYRGVDNSWGATAMTVSTDGLYEYIQSSSDANQFKIAASEDGWDYNHSYVQAGFNSTDVTNIGDYGQDNCYCWQSGDYYILVYYPNTAVNTTANPIICAATTLPEATASGAIKLTFTYFDKTDGDGSAKLNTVAGIFAEACQAYVSEVNVGTQVYAGRKYKEGNDSIFSNLKLGSSSAAGELKFKLANATEVDSIVFRAAMYANNEGGDGFSVNGTAFTLSTGKLKFEDKVWKPTGEVSSIDIVQTKANKGRFFLTSITIYPKAGETPEQPADPVVLPATLDVTNVSFRSEGMPDFVIEEGQDYAGTYFDMGAHDSANDTLLYAEWNVTIEPIKYNIAVDVYNTNSWRVQLYLLNQAGDTLKSLRYKGSSEQKGQYAIGSLDLSDLAAGDYKVRVHAATAWSAMKLKDVIFAADYQGVSVDLPGTLLPAYAELSNGASATAEAIAFAPSTAQNEYATWNVNFTEAGNFDVTIAITASNGHNYGVTLLSADGATEIGAVNEGGQNSSTGEKTLGAIAVPAAGNYIVKLTNSIQWSEALLNSITFAAAPAPTIPVVKLAGSLTSWEEPVLMANAEDNLSATLTLNLGIDHYQLKVVSDGNWLSKAGDGDLYTMHRDWNHVDHLDLINTGDNIKLITDVAGEYTFTWTYADSSLVVTFPEAPAQPKFYITGNEDIVGEGNPTWGKNGALESFSDTLVMNLAAGFHKFKLITPAEQWLGMEALTDTAYGLFTDDDTNICFNIAEAGAVTVIYNATEFKVEGNFYIAPVAKYYLIGDSAFVVDAGATADKAWTPDAIASFNDTTVLNLKAGVDYIMRLSLNGTWENHRDFRHLTDTAAGLIELPDEYQNRSIGFRLNEAGPVTIIYIPATNEQPEVFKLIGNFYVAPAPDPTVSVFGTMTDPAWEVEVPFTLSDDKSYATLTVDNIGAGEYNFKFFVNGEWRSNGYRFHREFTGAANITENNDANMVFAADQDGQYTFYWFFANDSLAITYPELPFACDWENIAFLGDGSPEQTHGNQFKLCKEGEQPGVVNIQKPGFAKESGIYVTFPSAAFGEISLPEGTYAIQGAGMILYCSAFDAQQETEVTVVCDNNPIVFTVYNANYTPVPPTGNIRLVPGVWNVDGAKFAAVTWHVGEAFENGTVSAWFEYLNADTLIGNVPNDADSIAFARFNSAAEVPSMDMSMIWNHTDKLLIDKQTMIYTISGWPEEGRDFCPGYWGEYVEPVYVLENGYYLVGNFSGVDAWSVEDLSAEKKFAANPDNEAEYQLAVNMAENDQVKVAYVENDQIIYWYPKGDNYTVDHNHAGPTTMYFRPDYFDDWNAFGGYFYIVPTSTVDITNIDANAQAVKAIRNGQLFIIKGEKTYNAQGTLVK